MQISSRLPYFSPQISYWPPAIWYGLIFTIGKSLDNSKGSQLSGQLKLHRGKIYLTFEHASPLLVSSTHLVPVNVLVQHKLPCSLIWVSLNPNAINTPDSLHLSGIRSHPLILTSSQAGARVNLASKPNIFQKMSSTPVGHSILIVRCDVGFLFGGGQSCRLQRSYLNLFISTVCNRWENSACCSNNILPQTPLA